MSPQAPHHAWHNLTPRQRSHSLRLALALLVVLTGTLLLLIGTRINTNTMRAHTAAEVAAEVCAVTNYQGAALRAIIVDGAKATKPFEPIMRHYGLPPYAVRVQRAIAQADTLPVLPNCPLVYAPRTHRFTAAEGGAKHPPTTAAQQLP